MRGMLLGGLAGMKGPPVEQRNRISPADARTKGGLACRRQTAPWRLPLAEVVVPRLAVVSTARHAALLESAASSRRDIDHSVRASPRARHLPCTTRCPRFTWVSL